MKFNDYKLSSENECEMLKKSYSQVLKQEVDDLNEIVEKMLSQKENLEKQNVDGRYSEIIEKLTEDINKLKNIVHSTIHSKKDFTNYTLSVPSSYRKISKLNDPAVVTPIRSIEENEKHEEYMENLIPNNTPNIPAPSPQPSKPATTSKRSRPMHSGSIINLFAKLALNKKSARRLAPIDRWRYHTIITTSCHPKQQLLHGQIDIIRLLLLYLTLRPTCKYMSVVASITHDQFENYINLIDL